MNNNDEFDFIGEHIKLYITDASERYSPETELYYEYIAARINDRLDYLMNKAIKDSFRNMAIPTSLKGK